MSASQLLSADAFLAQCVRCVLAGECLPEWPENRADNPRDTGYLERIDFHGIALLLSSAASGIGHWPQAIVNGVQDMARLAALWEELHRPAITQLIADLKGQGIASMVLKGSAVAYLHYDDPAMRRRGDTDLLVHPGDVERAREHLIAMGAQRSGTSPNLYYQESWLVDCGAGMLHTIDLHWHPSDRPVIQKILRPEEFWDSRVPVPRLSPHASAPDAVLMLVHGAINQIWHETRGFHVENERVIGGRRLIWAVDYHHLIQSFTATDWARLVAFCQQRDAGAIVASALSGAKRDIGLGVDDGVLADLMPASGRSPTLDYIQSFDLLKDLGADLIAAQSLGARWRIIRGMAFANREHLVGKYPQASHWPTAALQVRRYGDALGRLLGRSPRGRAYHLGEGATHERKP